MPRPSPLVPALALALVALSVSSGAQQPRTVDTSSIGPHVGARVPPFNGIDQFGKTHSLDSSLGPKGAMLVFFRSADW